MQLLTAPASWQLEGAQLRLPRVDDHPPISVQPAHNSAEWRPSRGWNQNFGRSGRSGSYKRNSVSQRNAEWRLPVRSSANWCKARGGRGTGRYCHWGEQREALGCRSWGSGADSRAPRRLQRERMVARGAGSDDFEMDDLEDFDTADMDEEAEEDMLEDGLEFDEPEEHDLSEESYSIRDADEKEAEEVQWTELEEVDYAIDERQFHCIQLHNCNFFIKIAPDKDNDVYDFQEMYVAAPDSDTYAIPKVKGTMPTKPLRCTKGQWKVLLTKELPLSSQPRQPAASTMDQVTKVFLIKHHLNRRASHKDFTLHFEETYVLDSEDRSIQRGEVKVDVPGGKKRDRKKDLMTVRENGTSFRIIQEDQRKTPDQVIEEYQWQKSRAALEAYLRGYRDYEKSNWF